MKIFIPTLGRPPEDQHAYEQLTRAGLAPVLVVDKTDKADYSAFEHVKVKAKGIAQKRQAILELAAGEKFAMFDDDMTIRAVDMNDTHCLISVPTITRVKKEISLADKLLDKYAHGGVHTRHFVNHAAKPYHLNRGYIRGGLGFFNPELMPKVPRFKGDTAEDVRFFIDLLNQGLDYFIITSCCMQEIKSATLPSHFTQEKKNYDMLELGAENAGHVRATRDGRITLTYANILKAAKKRLGIPLPPRKRRG